MIKLITSSILLVLLYGPNLWALDLSGSMEYGLWHQKHRMYLKNKEVKLHEMMPGLGTQIDSKLAASNPMLQEMLKEAKRAEAEYKNGTRTCITKENINALQDMQMQSKCKIVGKKAFGQSKYTVTFSCSDQLTCVSETVVEAKKKYTTKTKCTGSHLMFDSAETTGVWLQKVCPPGTLPPPLPQGKKTKIGG